MKRYSALGIILLAGAALPDELVLRSGLHLSGIYYGGSAQAVRFATTAEPDRIQTFSEQNVKAVFFGEEQPAKAVESVPRPSSYQPALPVPVAQRSILRAGVNCTVLLIDPIDSKHEGQGRSYRASIDVPVYAGGATVIPHGADVLLTLVEDQNSGHFGGKTVLTVVMSSIAINGQTYSVNSTGITKASASRTNQTLGRVGAGTGIGAAIGGLAGGGRGIGIGALAGAAAGTLAQIVTSGERVRIPSETRLTFALKEDLPL